MFNIGCCGFTVAKTKYYEQFDLVEVQQTFFQPPSQRVLASWRATAPANFRFIVKAWQLITHDPMSPTYNKLQNPIADYKRLNYGFFRPTGEVWNAWTVTEKAAELLGARMILFQCPSNFKPTEENIANMKAFFGKVRRKDYTFIFEPRGHWQDKEVKAVCEELDLVHGVDPFRQPPCHGNIKYLRLQGKGGYNYRYTDAEIREVIERYKEDPEVYVLFNNTNMFYDAIKMKELWTST